MQREWERYVKSTQSDPEGTRCTQSCTKLLLTNANNLFGLSMSKPLPFEQIHDCYKVALGNVDKRLKTADDAH